MFARVTTYELEQGRASEAIDAFEPAIDRIRELEGFVDGYFLVERDGRHAVTMTLWETLDTMERSRVTRVVRADRGRARRGANVTSTYEYEVRIHTGASEPGRRCRRPHPAM